MKPISSYDNAYEHHERSLRESEARTAAADVKLEQETLGAMALALCHLIEDAEGLEDLDQAEAEAREILQRVQILKLAKNHAAELLRGLK